MEDIEDTLKYWEDRVNNFNGFDEPTEEMLDLIRKKRRLAIRIQRTASTSISQAIGGDNRHMSAHTFKKKLKGDWDSIFKFSICRNPYTRFVSAYNAFHKDNRDINVFLQEAGLERLMRVRFFPLLPQHVYLYKHGKLLVDYVGRFEELDKAWKYISKRLDFKKELPHIGQTKKAELNKESKRMIYPFYKKDFELFGYRR